jgi:alpha-ribazole phosphatase
MVRHTRVANPQHLCYGRTDMPLATTAERDIADVIARAPWLPDAHTPVLCSPSTRCQKLASSFGAPVTTDHRLAEMDFGAWEGKSWASIGRDAVDRWNGDLANERPPAGESLTQVRERTAALLEELQDSQAERYLLITHGGVIRVLVATVLGIPLESTPRLTIDTGSFTAIEVTDTWADVRYVNR